MLVQYSALKLIVKICKLQKNYYENEKKIYKTTEFTLRNCETENTTTKRPYLLEGEKRKLAS